MATKSEKKSKAPAKARKTEFSLSAPLAQTVFTAGDFNQWNPASHPLTRDDQGIWRVSLALNPGRYQYRFLVDGEWRNDPKGGPVVESPFGMSISLKIVK